MGPQNVDNPLWLIPGRVTWADSRLEPGIPGTRPLEHGNIAGCG